jgi:hypothetical protein
MDASIADNTALPHLLAPGLARLMKLASQTTMSTGSRMTLLSRLRAFVCSWTTTRGSCRSFHASWFVPTSTA